MDVTENVEFYFEGTYNRRLSHQRLAPDASFAVNSSVETPNNGSQWNDYVPADNPYNPFGSVACSNTAGDGTLVDGSGNVVPVGGAPPTGTTLPLPSTRVPSPAVLEQATEPNGL